MFLQFGDFILTFTFPPATQNIVVGALLYIFFVLFYLFFKRIIIEKKIYFKFYKLIIKKTEIVTLEVSLSEA